jgi:dipeptidyl aminopeptidase/acylaminoacyl peptidase
MKQVWTAAIAALIACAANAQAQAVIPVEEFFKPRSVAEVHLSPNGRQMAVVVPGPDGHQRLVITDTQTLKSELVASLPGASVTNVHWASDKRLVFSAADLQRQWSFFTFSFALYAVDVDGRDFRYLVRHPEDWGLERGQQAKISDAGWHFWAATWKQDSDEVFVRRNYWKNNGNLDHVSVSRLNTRSGREDPVERPGDTQWWAPSVDETPRMAGIRDKEGKVAVMWLDKSTGKWDKVGSYDPYTGEGDFDPVGYVSEDILYVTRRAPGTDTTALYTFDPRKKEFSQTPLVSAKGFDISPRLIRSGNKIIGARYTSDAVGTVWFDPEMKKVQARIDALLPATINVIDVPLRAEVPTMVVRAFSDREPGQYFLYDSAKAQLAAIGRTRPGIQAALMAPRDLVRIKARDGLEMPVWTTIPKDGKKGPRPAVVLVHGGPWSHDIWRWNAEAQFLASRGYAVIEPEFRGSTGFGFKHFHAGWKQWGLKMQDDVADATRWAIDKGIIDPKRICIAGASYGGYATLMGLVNNPELFRCGFEWVGVTDIELLYTAEWGDFSQEYKTFGMPVLVGDRVKDAAQLSATSPLQQAARIKQPLLMAYGERDNRVPIEHGKKFLEAVSKTNSDVEFVSYDAEYHGWRELKTNVDFWTRVEKFLARNIGGN